MLVIEHLGKSFYHRPILADLNLVLDSAEIVAIMGKNGVGKSTFLRILARISAPTKGRAKFKERDLFKGPSTNRRGILYLGHAPGLYSSLSAVENLILFSGIYETPVSQKTIYSVLDRVNLTAQATDPIKVYSQGMLQRLKLALALIIDWKLLLFDEPFTGLDVQGRGLTESILVDWKAEGRTIILVTHDFSWSWNFCSRVVFLDNGRVGSDYQTATDNYELADTRFKELFS